MRTGAIGGADLEKTPFFCQFTIDAIYRGGNSHETNQRPMAHTKELESDIFGGNIVSFRRTEELLSPAPENHLKCDPRVVGYRFEPSVEFQLAKPACTFREALFVRFVPKSK